MELQEIVLLIHEFRQEKFTREDHKKCFGSVFEEVPPELTSYNTVFTRRGFRPLVVGCIIMVEAGQQMT